MTDAQEILDLAERIKPLLAHKPPQVQSAVLAELLAIWLAGHHIPGDPDQTTQLRAELLAQHCKLVRVLVKVNDKIFEPARLDFYLCPRCGAKSFNPNDIVHRYCGSCHRFEDG
jgi:ribosomal protein S27AE